jgi:hypothetical protein
MISTEHLFLSGSLPLYTVHTDHKTTICPGCGLVLPDRHLDPPDRFNASGECWQLFSDLSCYTVSKQDPEFIHQYVVDAYEAQHVGGKTRNITVIFGLIGLYLALEKGYTGKQVQCSHADCPGAERLAPVGTSRTASMPDRIGRDKGPGRS